MDSIQFKLAHKNRFTRQSRRKPTYPSIQSNSSDESNKSEDEIEPEIREKTAIQLEYQELSEYKQFQQIVHHYSTKGSSETGRLTRSATKYFRESQK